MTADHDEPSTDAQLTAQLPQAGGDLLPADSNERVTALVTAFFANAADGRSARIRAWVSAIPMSATAKAQSWETLPDRGRADLPVGVTDETRALAVAPLHDLSGRVIEDPRQRGFGLALCVSTATPFQWRAVDLSALAAIAATVGAELQLRADVARHERLADKLRHHPFNDPLTDLANRDLFLDHVGQALLRCARNKEGLVAVLSLSLDQFSGLERGFGYDAAQEVLMEFAHRLRAAVRNVDTVARVAGNEFGILLESLRDESDAARVASRVHDALRIPIETTRGEFMVSASIGVVLNTNALDSPERLVQLAALACERAKGTGAAYEVFDPAMQQKAQSRLKRESGLRRAIEAGEFELYYQPIIAVGTGRVVQLEALVRWQHPTRGLVAASDFIGLAEETGLIVPMGWLAMTEACDQLRRWRALGGPYAGLAVSINISAAHLRHREIVEKMRVAVGDLPPGSVNLEITESLLIEDPKRAKAMLAELRAFGVGIYLDDFGTGYSSLQYLHELPLDVIKIDRRFIARLGRDSRDAHVAATIRELARQLQIPVVAEGVETHEHLVHVRALECEFAQGYLFSYPLPVTEVSALLDRDPRW